MAFNFRRIFEGLGIVPKNTTGLNPGAGDMEVLKSDNKLRYHNGTSFSPVLTEAHSATVTNKTIDADFNTISNIDNNEIKALAGIDATKIANGTVNNTEYQYLDGVNAPIQTQIDALVAAGATYANKSLSNLTSPTAINQDLLPNLTETKDIGSQTNIFKDVYAKAINLVANTYRTSFKANPALASDIDYTLPVDYGTPGYALSTDGMGGLTWAPASGLTIIQSLTNNQVAPSDVTGFLVNDIQNKAFYSDYVIRRIYGSGISLSTGMPDTAFNNNLNLGFNGRVYSIKSQSDGKILVGGFFPAANNLPNSAKLVRLNADGTYDTAFISNLGTGFGTSLTDGVRGIFVQTDGKILVFGNFTSFNGNTRNYIIRLNSDGTEDTAFYTALGTGFNNTILDVITDNSGRYLIGGAFTSFNGNTRNRLVRLNTNLTEDTAFYTALGTAFPSGQVNKISVIIENSIYIASNTIGFNGNATRRYFIKLNDDGSEDTVFNNALGTSFNGQVFDFVNQDSTHLVIVGQFTSFNGNTRNRIVRIAANGTEDTLFYTNLGTAFNSDTYGIIGRSDDSVVVVGAFTLVNGNSRNKLALINSNGTDNSTFYANTGGIGGGNALYDVHIKNERILAGGDDIGLSIGGDNTPGMFAIAPTGTGLIEYIETGKFRGLYRDSTMTWELVDQTYGGDNSDVTLSITALGQLQYTTGNIAGTEIESSIKLILNKI